MRHSWHNLLVDDAPDLPVRAFRKALGRNAPATLEGIGGGKGGGSAPQAPDPYAVAGATTQTNQQSAAYNKDLNLNNYTNPFGSQQSTISGYGPSGAPIYQTNITSNPQLQGVMNGLFGQVGNSPNLNKTSLNDMSALADRYTFLNQNLQGLGNTLSPEAAQNAQQQGQDAAYKSQTQYLDPQFSQQGESLASQLANQGLTPGSEAYRNAMLNFNNQKQQAYSNAQNQSVLTGSQIGTQNWQNQLAGVTTKGGLFGQMGSNLGAQGNTLGQIAQVGQLPYQNLQTIAGMVPSYSGTAQSAAQPANIGQNIYSNYQGQLDNYNARTASSNQMMGGLFGLGSAGIMGMMGNGASSIFSDRRLKTAVKRIGAWANGLGVYSYRYLWEPTGARHLGFMADEVRKVRPDAVSKHESGFDMVNYSRAAV